MNDDDLIDPEDMSDDDEEDADYVEESDDDNECKSQKSTPVV